MSTSSGYYKLLKKHLPTGTIYHVLPYLEKHKPNVKVTRPRATKLGDYRSPYKGKNHQITINNDLHPYAFLLTLCHEIAHMVAYVDFGNKIKPHGSEWKTTFREVLQPFSNELVLPQEILDAVNSYLENPRASSCSDHNLTRVLRSYSTTDEVLLETLPENAVFAIKKRVFKKLQKQRTRYKCKDLKNGKLYLVSGIAEVSVVDN